MTDTARQDGWYWVKLLPGVAHWTPVEFKDGKMHTGILAWEFEPIEIGPRIPMPDDPQTPAPAPAGPQVGPMPHLVAVHVIITEQCRINRTNHGALMEAFSRVEKEYLTLCEIHRQSYGYGVKFHVRLEVELPLGPITAYGDHTKPAYDATKGQLVCPHCGKDCGGFCEPGDHSRREDEMNEVNETQSKPIPDPEPDTNALRGRLRAVHALCVAITASDQNLTALTREMLIRIGELAS